MHRPIVAIVAALLVSAASPVGAVAGPPAPQFIFQDKQPTPLLDSHTYVLRGTVEASGSCTYAYPPLKVPAGAERWEVRALGIDPANCAMLIEEGVPSAVDFPTADNTLAAPVGAAGHAEAQAASSVASGYTSAWYEDAAGIHVTQDTTYISWNYTGSCVSGGSSSGQWSWDSLFTLVSHGGTNSYSGCSWFMGDTWSTMKTISLPCPWTTVWTYYYHIRTYGWKDGSVTASHSDNWAQNGCPLPLWPHWGYAKTG